MLGIVGSVNFEQLEAKFGFGLLGISFSRFCWPLGHVVVCACIITCYGFEHEVSLGPNWSGGVGTGFKGSAETESTRFCRGPIRYNALIHAELEKFRNQPLYRPYPDDFSSSRQTYHEMNCDTPN